MSLDRACLLDLGFCLLPIGFVCLFGSVFGKALAEEVHHADMEFQCQEYEEKFVSL